MGLIITTTAVLYMYKGHWDPAFIDKHFFYVLETLGFFPISLEGSLLTERGPICGPHPLFRCEARFTVVQHIRRYLFIFKSILYFYVNKEDSYVNIGRLEIKIIICIFSTNFAYNINFLT